MIYKMLAIESFTTRSIIELMAVSFILGVIIALVFMYTHRKFGYDRSFAITLMILPVLISVIITLVSNDLARAFSLAGLFTLVRFRTQITDTKDIAFILATVAIGLACGLNYMIYAVIVTVFISLILFLLNIFKFDRENDSIAKLKILVPENLNYVNAFDDVFEKYLKSSYLQKVKTSDFGTMFELTYVINLKKNVNNKDFLDELRVKNGNLNIVLINEYVNRVSE